MHEPDEPALVRWLYAFAEQGRQETAWNELIEKDHLWRALERAGKPPRETAWKITQAIVAAEEARPVANREWHSEAEFTEPSFPATVMAIAMFHRPDLGLHALGFQDFADAFRALVRSADARESLGPGHGELLQDIYVLWAWDVIRGLPVPASDQSARTDWRHPVTVPIAFEGQTGRIGWLSLELLPGGRDTAVRVLQHPRDRLAVVDGPAGAARFAEAIALAFHRSLDGMTEAGETRFEARWRIVDQHDRPITRIQGNSAGGAALLGWSVLLAPTIDGRPEIADPRILVAGSLGPGASRVLQPVGGMTKKIEALLAFNTDLSLRGGHPAIDTVIVSPAQLGHPDDPIPSDPLKPAGILPVFRAAGSAIEPPPAGSPYWIVQGAGQHIRVRTGFETP